MFMEHARLVFVAGVSVVFWAVAGQPQTARATELRAAYGVHLDSAQRASDEDVWSCPVGPCATTGGVNASVEFDQWGHYASAEATPRTLHARTYAQWPDSIYTPRFANAWAQISDTLTLTHPEIDPIITSVSTWMRVRFAIDGALDFTGSGTADFTTVFTAQNPTSTYFGAARFEASYGPDGLVLLGNGPFAEDAWPGGTTGNPFGVFEAYMLMPYNQPLSVMWVLSASAGLLPAHGGTAGSAHVQLQNTATLLGIDVVELDPFGSFVAVEGARVVSASGFDWGVPLLVSEPATTWLLLAGLGGWVLRRR